MPEPIISVPWSDDTQTLLDWSKVKVDGELATDLLKERDRYRSALEHYTGHRYTCSMFNPSPADRERGESCDCGAEVALKALGLPTKNQ